MSFPVSKFLVGDKFQGDTKAVDARSKEKRRLVAAILSTQFNQRGPSIRKPVNPSRQTFAVKASQTVSSQTSMFNLTVFVSAVGRTIFGASNKLQMFRVDTAAVTTTSSAVALSWFMASMVYDIALGNSSVMDGVKNPMGRSFAEGVASRAETPMTARSNLAGPRYASRLGSFTHKPLTYVQFQWPVTGMVQTAASRKSAQVCTANAMRPSWFTTFASLAFSCAVPFSPLAVVGGAKTQGMGRVVAGFFGALSYFASYGSVPIAKTSLASGKMGRAVFRTSTVLRFVAFVESADTVFVDSSVGPGGTFRVTKPFKPGLVFGAVVDVFRSLKVVALVKDAFGFRGHLMASSFGGGWLNPFTIAGETVNFSTEEPFSPKGLKYPKGELK